MPIPLPLSWSAKKAMQSPQSATTPILLTLKWPPIISGWVNSYFILKEPWNKGQKEKHSWSFFPFAHNSTLSDFPLLSRMKYSLIRRPLGQVRSQNIFEWLKKYSLLFRLLPLLSGKKWTMIMKISTKDWEKVGYSKKVFSILSHPRKNEPNHCL